MVGCSPGAAWKMEVFLDDDDITRKPLRFTLDGADPDELSAEAWQRISAYKKG